MADDIDEELIQGVRAWVYKATGLDRKQIIPADDPGERPKLPYIMVDLLMFDDQRGQDEQEPGCDAAGNPTVGARGYRRATISLQGYGRGAAQLLIQAALRLQRPEIKTLLQEHDFSVRPISPALNISELASNEIEKRFAKDFELQYLLRDTDPEVLVEPTTFTFDMTYEPGSLLDTLTITC